MPDDHGQRRRWEPGVIEFHRPGNERLVREFHDVLHDCAAAGAIVDLYLMDIGTILARHGYEMAIYLREDG